MGILEAFFGRFGESNIVPLTKILGLGRCGLQEIGSTGGRGGRGIWAPGDTNSTAATNTNTKVLTCLLVYLAANVSLAEHEVS